MADKSNKTIMIAGGGTGGHVFPGVAVAESLRRIDPEIEVVFVGTDRGLEARAIPKLGYTLEKLNVRYVKGTGLWGWTRGALLLPSAGIGAMQLLGKHRPAAVISVGGYAAGPMTITAATVGYPTALMEQNARPGMTNRILGSVVDRCFVNFEETEGLPPEKSLALGNPVRQAILDAADTMVDPREEDAPFRVFITGGSGGAGSMNRELPQMLRRLPDARQANMVVRHQAGRGRNEPVADAYRGFLGEVEVTEFIDDMAEAYLWADMVICRAGATTLSELLVLGKPAMYIPFPGAADNHQEKNARRIVEAGAGLMLLDHEMASTRGERLLSGMMENRQTLHRMAIQARSLGRPSAGSDIAQAILELAGLNADAGYSRAA